MNQKYTAQNGIWDDNKKKFVKKGTIDWKWVDRLLDFSFDTEIEYGLQKSKDLNKKEVVIL